MTAQLNLFGPQIETDDAELESVAEELTAADPEGVRIARALRRTYDMLLDGQHTGRYRWDQLAKTEKTHFGTLAEINMQRAFGFADGQAMDFAIRGLTNAAGNRDRKRWLSPHGKASVTWLFKNKKLPDNALLRIPPRHVDQIFSCSAHGSKRLDMLFRLAQRRVISRTVVATVAQQYDYMRRVRGNGGSRGSLRAEGIVIFGDYRSHRHVARQLGLTEPAPESGESVSVRLARLREHHQGQPSVILDSEPWVVALDDDRPEEAPLLPDTKA